MNCGKCGFEMSPAQNGSFECKNCGNKVFMEVKPKFSALGITAFILSLLCCLSPIGLILGIIDLAVSKDKRKGLSVAAVSIGAITTLFIIIAMFSGESDYTDATNSQITETTVTDNKDKEKDTQKKPEKESEKESEKEDDTLGVGSTFIHNNTKITIESFDEDFKDYDSYNAPDDGKKYIRIGVTFEYIGSKGSIYVSSSDFNLYVDNVAYKNDSFVGDDDFYIVELTSGRKVSGGSYYQIPIDAKVIELEYKEMWMNNPIIIKLK